jgi:hypothetical protein
MNMVARSFNSAEEQIAFYRALRARTRPQPAPVVYIPAPLRRTIYAEPIGPTRPGRTIYDRPIGPYLLLSRDVIVVATPASITTPILAKQILRECAGEGGLNVEELTGDRRDAVAVRWRQKAMYRMSKELGWSTPRIGRELGGRDHTTVMHGIQRHAERIGSGK